MRSQFSTRAALSAAALSILAACTAGDLAAPAANEADTVAIAAARGSSINQAPTAWISSPSQNASFASGTSIYFSGYASDRESGLLSGAALVWKSSRDGQFGTGKSLSFAGLSVGTHTISFTATDPQGLSFTHNRTITITGAPNQVPVASISAPASGASVVQGTSVTFSGSGTDAEDGSLPDSALTWTSSNDGPIGVGRSVVRNNLSVGTHTITLSVKDSKAATASSARTITVTAATVANESPWGWIESPANGASVAQGTAVSFSGSAGDPEDGALSGASVVWTSSINGQIGTGLSFSKSNLSVGTHTITMTTTDSRGASFAHNRSLTITAAVTPTNQSPTANISAPGNGSSYTSGASVSFAGSATDPESGTLSGASLVWTSSRDGQIGTGTSFSKANLTVGTHTITLTARDAQGATGVVTRSITINSTAPVNQAPVANFTSSCVLLVCSFNAGSSTDDSGVTQYTWNFGNGTTQTVTVATVSNTYLVAGAVNVTLTVRDAAGLTNSITKSVSPTAGSTTPPASGGVEPTGMTLLAENNFSCVTNCGNGWYFQQGYANAAQVVADAAAPRSGANVGQQNFTPSLSGGSSPASIGTGLPNKQTLYVSMWMKISSNYVGHPGSVNKVIHFYTDGGNRMIFILRGSGTGPLSPGFNTQGLAAPYTFTEGGMTITGSTEANLSPNVNACTVVRGQWHRYEMILTNNTNGVADGKAELWMDGVKCMNYTGIQYVAAGRNNKWEELNWSPTYGGGSATITTSFYSQVDHIYASGK